MTADIIRLHPPQQMKPRPRPRYSVMVVEYGSDHEVELVQLDGDTAPVVAGLRAKTLRVGLANKRRLTKIPKYTSVRVIDHGEKQ
jgi:hypothetical protein